MLLWNVHEYKEGMIGSAAMAGSYKLMVMPIFTGDDPDNPGKKLVAGYSFCVVSDDGSAGSSFMTVSRTIQEAQQQAEMAFLLKLLGALSAFRSDTLDAFIEHMKFLLKPTLEESFQLIEQLRQRNEEIRAAIAARVQSEQGNAPQQMENADVQKGH